jgi:prepilin-type N-terminal cleavage/methylation domain-containing protein
MKKNRKRTENGFTLIELMVAMAITLVVLSAIFMTFKSQQDSYVVQDQVTRMQQNLRGAMYVMTRDIQMAGYYTNFDSGSCTTDWDNLDDDNDTSTGTESLRPLVYGDDNVSVSGDDIKDGTDVLVIVKADPDFRRDLTGTEEATGGTITLSDRELDGDAGNSPDLDNNANKFGLLVKRDLTDADFFEVTNNSNTIATKENLSRSYTMGDHIFRADVIIYKVDEDGTHPKLQRKNLSSNSGSTTVAEDIDSFQVRYRLNDGSWVTASAANFNPANVRAIEVSLLARTGRTIRGYTDPNTYILGGDDVTPTPADNYRRKVLTSVIETRNIGL